MHIFNVGWDGSLDHVTNTSIIKHWPREGGIDQRRICDVSDRRVNPNQAHRSKRAYQSHQSSWPERAIDHADDAISQDAAVREDRGGHVVTTTIPLMQHERADEHTLAFADDDAGGDIPDDLFVLVRKETSRSCDPLLVTCLPEKEDELLPIGDARRIRNPAATLTNTSSTVDPRTLAELVGERMQVRRRCSTSSDRTSLASYVAFLIEPSMTFDALNHPLMWSPSEARSGERDQDDEEDNTTTSAALMNPHRVEGQMLPAGLRSKARRGEEYRLSTDRLGTVSVVLGIASEVKLERYCAKEVYISRTREYRERAERSNHGAFRSVRGK